MALMDFIKKQFIDVIQCAENDDDVIAWRFPMQGMEIRNGAILTVRESQVSVFVNEGQIADVFEPGRYELTTNTLPVLTYLKNWDKLFESPFKSDVYFFSTRQRLDRKWGTANPVTVRDAEFGAVRLRAFGIYSYRLVDAKKFHTSVSGTLERYGVEELESQLRNTIVGHIAGLFGETSVPFLDMAANQELFGQALKEKVAPLFDSFGLALDNFVVQNISLPEELEKALDARINMNLVGDLGQYTRYQVASSIPLAAQNEGGAAGAGVGIGAGISMGQVMGQSMLAATQAPAPAPSSGTSLADEIAATLEKLHALVGKGILSQDEFDAKKAEILKKLD
ncbi:MAG: SPFH domain-containing protein [Betaproteobacteria bacterium]|jgi:membrane protease subunit (stomatin/prohibitin family)|nr:SPFH domain-containing protein [Betaproteobacteria bacterium]